ncbi:DUF3231 family protein [Alteribacillus sp. HJP-4]|uniref:DUF3231 family protein n=1 Tax=Alteribacillus sp. HJP-4 TaxID=2775394 RepID=UPI0035CD388E
MGMMSGNPKKEPMHYGEIFGMWSYLSVAKGAYALYETFMNHAGDEDLKDLIKGLLKNIEQEEAEIEETLKVNGIPLPPTPPERSMAKLEDIPMGARINDPEIAAHIATDIATGLVACSQVMGQSTREDIALMFGKYHMSKAQAGAKGLRLSKKKGWLIAPPLHTEVPAEV